MLHGLPNEEELVFVGGEMVTIIFTIDYGMV
jgi:hypothetical protein